MKMETLWAEGGGWARPWRPLDPPMHTIMLLKNFPTRTEKAINHRNHNQTEMSQHTL